LDAELLTLDAPGMLVPTLLRAAYHELREASEMLVGHLQTPGYRNHPDHYAAHLDRLDAARCLISFLSAALSTQAASFHIDVAKHGALLVRLLRTQRSVLGEHGQRHQTAGPDSANVLSARDQLLLGIEAVVDEHDACVSRQTVWPRRAEGLDVLTAREKEILHHLARDRRYAEIAVALCIDIETVRTHAKRIRRKLGVSTSRELAGLY
jgi:DNA-binding CsgD family transcriptional regulator